MGDDKCIEKILRSTLYHIIIYIYVYMYIYIVLGPLVFDPSGNYRSEADRVRAKEIEDKLKQVGDIGALIYYVLLYTYTYIYIYVYIIIYIYI
jgi:hypothetical protein